MSSQSEPPSSARAAGKMPYSSAWMCPVRTSATDRTRAAVRPREFGVPLFEGLDVLGELLPVPQGREQAALLHPDVGGQQLDQFGGQAVGLRAVTGVAEFADEVEQAFVLVHQPSDGGDLSATAVCAHVLLRFAT
jgi:hypothetical protein